jgi:hypothetical protein
MASFYPFQRVKLARPHPELPAGTTPVSIGITGTLISLVSPRKVNFVSRRTSSSFIGWMNCEVMWDDDAHVCGQHTDQLEPILDLLDKEEEQEEEKVL